MMGRRRVFGRWYVQWWQEGQGVGRCRIVVAGVRTCPQQSGQASVGEEQLASRLGPRQRPKHAVVEVVSVACRARRRRVANDLVCWLLVGG